MKKNKKAFSIIEVLVGMVIFFIGISAIFSLVTTTIDMNNTNKNYTIGTNLAREQLELFKNIRNSNIFTKVNKIRGYSVIPSSCEGTVCSKKFESGKIYKISNDFRQDASFPVKVEEVSNSNIQKPYDLSNLKKFQVCFDENQKLYDYCSNINGNKKELNIYKFIEVSEVGNDFKTPNISENLLTYQKNGGEPLGQDEALKVKSKVIWFSKRFQEFEVTRIFTNYKM